MKRQNGITIEDVMAMDCMKKCKVIAGFRGTRNTVAKVNIMADPDILDWVDEGEFLLTTAYSFRKDDVEEQKRLVRECAKKGLAGIGIKIYPYLESLSQEVIDLANGLGFPLIDLHYSIPFTDIMTPVFREIFNKQTSLLQRLEKVHEELMGVALTEGSFEEIGKVVFENLKNPVVIQIRYPDQMFCYFESVELSQSRALLENVQQFYTLSLNRKDERQFDESTVFIQGKYIRRMAMPIIVKSVVYGHIFAWAVDTPLGGFDLSVLETSSTTISLEILKLLSIRDVENRYRAELIEDLLSFDTKRKDKAIEGARAFLLHAEDQYVMTIVQVDNKQKKIGSPLQDNMDLINTSIERLAEALGVRVFFASKTDSIYILLSFPKEKKVESIVKCFYEKIEKIWREEMKWLPLAIGIGRPYEGLSRVYKSYEDGVKALQAGEVLGVPSPVYFEELGIYKLLCQEELREELEKFYRSTLYPLVDYDMKKSTELVRTLEMYFQYNGNLKKISEMLFTHYNTTLYRMQRIQEITKMNLENPAHRLNLEMALKIKKILNIAPAEKMYKDSPCQ